MRLLHDAVLRLVVRVLFPGAPVIPVDFFYSPAHQQNTHKIKAEPYESRIGGKMFDLFNFLHLLGCHKTDAQASEEQQDSPFQLE